MYLTTFYIIILCNYITLHINTMYTTILYIIIVCNHIYKVNNVYRSVNKCIYISIECIYNSKIDPYKSKQCLYSSKQVHI